MMRISTREGLSLAIPTGTHGSALPATMWALGVTASGAGTAFQHQSDVACIANPILGTCIVRSCLLAPLFNDTDQFT